jgi:menaquinone-dependent protoporphyrinogen IX oxidase
MANVLIVYATIEGQTGRIAEQIAGRLQSAGHRVAAHEARAGVPLPPLHLYDA